ncbi:MAG TPA: glutamate 5-kinase [Rickettsiales bacterium]|nr:glutamate 5-kinase [Rickettsiales bacterium]
MHAHIKKAKRLVIKVGTSILTGGKGTVRRDWMKAIARDIEAARKRGTQVVVVTSGAADLGRKMLGMTDSKLKLEEKQAVAACGQILLMQAWRESLLEVGIDVAQVLLTIDDSENRRRYLNARGTLETLLANNIVPVINENDTVATAELKFGDNDRLAARVAQMVSADCLVLFSDIDGLYTGNPHTDKNATLIQEVREITPQIIAMAGAPTSGVGSGGMITKIEAAKIALSAGCHMAIAAGKELNPLRKLEESNHCTWFIASSTPISARKNWIVGSIAPAGVIIVDDGAAQALGQGKSLLPAGVKQIEGKFERGDTVLIRNLEKKELGRGLIAYSSEDAVRIIGHKSQEIEKILGFKGRTAIIHRDDLVLGGNR